VSTNPGSTQPLLLDVRGLGKTFGTSGLFRRRRGVVAAADVSFQVDRGRAVALVGESGSGKSTVARMLLRLEPPESGEIRLDGEDVLVREPRRASLGFRGRVQMVFQDPFGSLNPVHTVGHHLARPLLRHHRVPVSQVPARITELLQTVGLEPAAGGQRQRVAIARALAVEPDLLVADEPTSMLDVSIRMGILNLLAQLKRDRRLGILLITHDLASARYLADRVLVLYRGRVVEDGPSAALVEWPAHPYTRALLASTADVSGSAAIAKRPVESTASHGERGCPFASRCPDVLAVCRTTDPAPRDVDGRRVRCHLYPETPQVPAR
jgi:peptide/nickel transport system ATP-binding protein